MSSLLTSCRKTTHVVSINSLALLINISGGLDAHDKKLRGLIFEPTGRNSNAELRSKGILRPTPKTSLSSLLNESRQPVAEYSSGERSLQ